MRTPASARAERKHMPPGLEGLDRRARRGPAGTAPTADEVGGADKRGDDGAPLVALPVGLIHPHPLSAAIYGDGADLHLVEEIRQHGLIHPVVVTPRGDGYLLLSGHRRLQAVRRLGWATVPARVMEVTPEDEAELLIAANHAREKTASQRLREAQALEPVYTRRARERQLAGGTSGRVGVGRELHPRPPQIRTCRIPASGSSSQWFAAKRSSVSHPLA